jgi:hydrogenase maturation protease
MMKEHRKLQVRWSRQERGRAFAGREPVLVSLLSEGRRAMAPILVMGLGNVLLQDEGLGVRALRRLTERYILPDVCTN